MRLKRCKYCGTWTDKKNGFCSRKCYFEHKGLFGGRNESHRATDTLCWDCKKSTGGGDCPWANDFKPVDGWIAAPTKVKQGRFPTTESFIVIKCPLFKKG